MMKIEPIDLTRLQNLSHLFLFDEFVKLVHQFGADNLGIGTLFLSFEPLFAQEKSICTAVRKSVHTKELVKIDRERVLAYRTLYNMVMANLHHFDGEKREAARLLKIILDQEGYIYQHSLMGRSAVCDMMVQRMRGEYAPSVALLKLGEWVDRLDEMNKSYDKLESDRLEEYAARPDFSMRSKRQEVDALYKKMVKHIDALQIIAPSEEAANFIHLFNEHIHLQKIELAQRRGRALAKKKELKEESE